MRRRVGFCFYPADMTSDFIIDADDGVDDLDQPAEAATVSARIGGRVYTAHCPKDVVWAQLATAGAARSVSQQAYQVFSFLDAAFDPETADELERRYRDRRDPLRMQHLFRALRLITDHFRPLMEEQFEAMGLQLDDDPDDEPQGNRQQRRAQAAADRKQG